MLQTREVDLRRLNSATKYPSIPTYHALGERGALLPQCVSFEGEQLIATEKVDGTNSRIILMPDGCYLIGSREELLHAKGDLIHNPALGIVTALKSVADIVSQRYEVSPEIITTAYLETYGGKTTAAARQYTSNRAFGYRLFDVSHVLVSVLEREAESISHWREAGGQQFMVEDELLAFAAGMQLETTPRIAIERALPTSIEDTHHWLEQYMPRTLVALDEQAGGSPEGLVVRTPDRHTIAKIRFEDYARHEKRKNPNRKQEAL